MFHSIRYHAYRFCPFDLTNWGHEQCHEPIASPMDGLRHMAEALNFIHRNGYVHRDINPRNILISEEGGRLVISGFNLMKKLDKEGGYTGHDWYGYEKWLAPERNQYRRKIKELPDSRYLNRVTTACDTYSMGCVFHYFLTRGGHPLEDKGTPAKQSRKSREVVYTGILQGQCTTTYTNTRPIKFYNHI